MAAIQNTTYYSKIKKTVKITEKIPQYCGEMHIFKAFDFPRFLSRFTSNVIQVATLNSRTDKSNFFTIRNICIADK